MLSGHAVGFHERSSEELLLADPVAEIDDDEEALSGKVLYRASFEDLAKNHVQYDTLVWFMISLLLVLAWGVGVLMLLYIPFKRYVLRKEISSRTLCVTENKIVYMAMRPSFIPFLGIVKIEKQIPLHLVIDIIIEQGCLQSSYGLHTFRIESIAHGKAAPVDELQFQGVSNPELLRKVIITEAAKSIQRAGSRKFSGYPGEGIFTPRMRSLTEIPSISRLQSPPRKVKASPRRALFDAGRVIYSDVLLRKLEEIIQSLKKIESLVVGSRS
uniref:DUF7642 domain-containing protein n=1 Tax=Ananas comosus var. bracteatus TaxID=296719 RepID=A0A6V7QNF3_ANACO|nr:unnamed protein product [Ananas comosus var. bracteatus]